MIIDFRGASPEGLSELHNLTVSARYHIDPDLFRSHTLEHPTLDWGASIIDPGHAFIAVKRSPKMLYRGPNEEVAHICTLGYKDPTVLLDLLGDVRRCLTNRGTTRLQFGADSGHFFPGCPVDCHQLADFLSIAGFQGVGEAHDLERDLEDYIIPCEIPLGYEFRPVKEEDLPSLDAFLLREFPGRWHYDTFQKIRAEGSSEFVIGLFDQGRCEGFALTQIDGCKTQIGGAVWKSDLGKFWCSLGPIGISKRLRGKGVGNALLAKALESLMLQGGRKCIIDWTGLVEFYRAHGFEVTRTYKTMQLNLEAN